MEYGEETVSSRNGVVRLANKIINKIKDTGKSYTIVWGDVDSIKFIKDLANRKYKPKKTDMELRKDIVNFLRGKFKLGKKL